MNVVKNFQIIVLQLHLHLIQNFYRNSETEMKRLKTSMGIDAESDVALSLVSDNTQRLTSAVNSLPQMMEKKRLIDMHTTIATGTIYN